MMRRSMQGSCRWLWAAIVSGYWLTSAPATALVWPSVVEQIAEDLTSKETAERRSAAARLATLPRAAAHRLLARALRDSDPRVRVLAAEAAIATRYAEAAALVDPWLGDKDVDVRRAAARVLFAFPEHQKSLTRLARALGDPDTSVRLAVVEALGVSPSEAATAALLSQLDDTDPDVVVAVIEALERHGDPRSVVPLIGRLQDNRSTTRRAAARALGSLGDEAAVGALLVALRDSDARVRLAVVSALGHTRSEAAVSAVKTQLLEDDDIDVRVAALHALAAIGSPSAVRIVVDQLSTQRDELATEAARALSSLPRGSAPLLAECLSSSGGSVADGCAIALGRLRAEVSYEALTRALETRSITTVAALQAYGELGDARALLIVLEQLLSPHEAVRHAALLAADRLLDPAHPDGRAVEPIARALEQSAAHSEERVALIELLGQTGAERAAEVVAGFASERTPVRQRLAALTALGRTASERPALQRLLIDALDAEHGPIRFAAALALRRCGSAQWVTALLARLRAASVDRQAIAVALAGPLSRTDDAQAVEELRPLIASSAPPVRDALLEALAHVPNAGADALLASLTRGQPSARAKIAEVLGRRTTQGPLPALLSDENPSVRANAAWSALEQANADLLPRLLVLTSDPDVTVAANATAALSRVGETAQVLPELCRLVEDGRAHVRANALAALRLRGVRCPRQPARWALERDRSPLVRERAARLLAQFPLENDPSEARLLRRVTRFDVSERVASAAAGDEAKLSAEYQGNEGHWLGVFVVPAGRSEPVAGAPYALDAGDGLLRLGFTDERGAIFVRSVAEAELRLEVPPGVEF